MDLPNGDWIQLQLIRYIMILFITIQTITVDFKHVTVGLSQICFIRLNFASFRRRSFRWRHARLASGLDDAVVLLLWSHSWLTGWRHWRLASWWAPLDLVAYFCAETQSCAKYFSFLTNKTWDSKHVTRDSRFFGKGWWCGASYSWRSLRGSSGFRLLLCLLRWHRLELNFARGSRSLRWN